MDKRRNIRTKERNKGMEQSINKRTTKGMGKSTNERRTNESMKGERMNEMVESFRVGANSRRNGSSIRVYRVWKWFSVPICRPRRDRGIHPSRTPERILPAILRLRLGPLSRPTRQKTRDEDPELVHCFGYTYHMETVTMPTLLKVSMATMVW